MKPIQMESVGDCWRACLATILEVEYTEVPYFGDMADDPSTYADWYKKTLKFLEQYGLHYFEFRLGDHGKEHRKETLRGYHMIVGQSRLYREYKHACVGKDGEIVWDPNPREGAGIVPGTETYGVFVAMNPAHLIGCAALCVGERP